MDSPASLAVVVPFQEWWVHASSQAVEGSHGLLGKWEAPACPSMEVSEVHLLGLVNQQQRLVEEDLNRMERALTQGAWLLGTEMEQSWVEAQGKLKAGKWEGVR